MLKQFANGLFSWTSYKQKRTGAYIDLELAETEEEFREAFEKILIYAIDRLERSKNNFMKTGEDGISDALAFALSIPDLIEARREENSNGHADLTIETIRLNPRRKIIGEAKIDYNSGYVIKGIDQLLGYATGRESMNLLLVYVKNKPIVKSISAIRSKMDKTRPYGQVENTEDYLQEWSYMSEHMHSSGKPIRIHSIGCNMYLGK